jgi:hypothetical protein
MAFAAQIFKVRALPLTPAPVPAERTGHAKVNGISLYYATIGHGSPVVLLHGGLSNSDYWGNQIKALAPPQAANQLKCDAASVV